MKIAICCIQILTFTITSYPQAYWVEQECGTEEYLTIVRFIDNERGMVYGGNTILRTTNSGDNWQKLSISDKVLDITFRDNNTVFIITDKGRVKRSNDFGSNWVEQNIDTSIEFRDISFLNQIDGILVGRDDNFAVTILMTIDGGNSWEILSEKQYHINPAQVHFLDNKNIMIFSYSDRDILHTTDAGITWKKEKIDSSAGPYGFSSASFANKKIGIVISNFTVTSQKISVFYKTTDGGITWKSNFGPSTGGEGRGINCITSDIYSVIYNGRILRTTDGGNHWFMQNSHVDEPVYDLFFTDTENGFAVGKNGTILNYTSDIPESPWKIQHSGTKQTIRGASFINDSIVFAVGDGDSLLKSVDRGISWFYVSPQVDVNSDFFDIEFNLSGFGAAVAGYNLLYSSDFGNNWLIYRSSVWFNSVSLIGPSYGLVVGNNGIILNTTNRGETWKKQSSNTTENLLGINQVTEKSAYAVGNNGTILFTRDGGLNWIPKYSGTDLSLRGVNFLDINYGTVVGENGTIIHTTNGGNNWINQESGTSSHLYDIFYLNYYDGIIVGQNGTILRTSDGGENWHREIFTEVDLLDIAIQDSIILCVGSDGTIIRATNWIINPVHNIPENYHLEQNFPNPFNSSTKIQFSLHELSLIIIKIYDILGREVSTIIDEVKIPGTYILEFNAESLSSGIYFYQIQAGDFTETKKMLLVR